MKNNQLSMKKLITFAIVSLLAMASVQSIAPAIFAEEGSQHQVQYIGQDSESSQDQAEKATGQLPSAGETRDAGDKTQDQINDAEGIAAEQIVVQITDEGYVTSHGDHYHYYNGKVPANSILCETLLAPEDYYYDEADLVNEVEEGYIVKVDDQYYYVLKDQNQRDHLRTVDELVLQSKGIHPEEAHDIVNLRQELDLSKDSLISYEEERQPKDVAKDAKVKSEFIAVYLGEDYYVALYGMDLHIFPGKLPEDMKLSERLLTSAQYQFNQKDVIGQTKDGYLVSVKGQVRLYVKNHSQATNLVDDQSVHKQIEEVAKEYKEKGIDRKQDANRVAPGAIGGSGSRDGSGRYVTDDGYVFSPYHVIRDVGNGFIVPHDDHFHFIPKSDLTPSELAIAYQVLGKGGAKQAEMNQKIKHGAQNPDDIAAGAGSAGSTKPGRSQTNPKRYNSDQAYTTSDGYVFSVESIVSADADGMVTRHDGHFHYVPFADLSKRELQAAQAHLKRHLNIDRNLVDEYDVNKQVEKPSDDKKLETEQERPTAENESKKETPAKATVTAGDSALAKKLKKLYDLPKGQRHKEGDGLVFDPATIIDVKTLNGQISFRVPHGDHYHIVPASKLSALELELALAFARSRGLLSSTSDYSDTTPSSPSVRPHSPAKPQAPNQTKPKSDKVDFLSLNIKKSAQGKDGKQYMTSDNYVFTADSIMSYDEGGLITKHGDHFHYVPLADLDDNELKAAQDYINQHKVKPEGKTTEDMKVINKKLAFIALQNGVSVDDLKVTGDKVIVPHNDHTHVFSLKDTPTGLYRKDFESDKAYREMVIDFKKNYYSMQHKQDQVFIFDDEVAIYDGTRMVAKKLNDIKLPGIEYEEVIVLSKKVDRSPQTEPMVEDKKEKELLSNQKPKKEQADQNEDQGQSNTPEESESKVSVETLVAFLRQHYGADVSYFSGSFLVSFGEDVERLVITYDMALRAYQTQNVALLPVKPQAKQEPTDQPEESAASAQLETKEKTGDTGANLGASEDITGVQEITADSDNVGNNPQSVSEQVESSSETVEE